MGTPRPLALGFPTNSLSQQGNRGIAAPSPPSCSCNSSFRASIVTCLKALFAFEGGHVPQAALNQLSPLESQELAPQRFCQRTLHGLTCKREGPTWTKAPTRVGVLDSNVRRALNVRRLCHGQWTGVCLRLQGVEAKYKGTDPRREPLLWSSES